MNQEQQRVRDKIEKRLGHILPDETWEYFERGVDSVVKKTDTIDDFEVDVKMFLRAAGKLPATMEGPSSAVTKRGNSGAAPSRDVAVALLLAEKARREPELVQFRKDVLRHQLVEQAEVEGWLKKRSAAGTELEGREFVGFLRPNNSWPQRIPVLGDQALKRLKELSDSMSRRYGWQPAQSTVFILTDTAPAISMKHAEASENFHHPVMSRLVLTLDPALSPRQVADFYRKAWKALMEPGRYRNLSEKHTLLAAFSVDRADSPRLREAWNRKYPKWAYASESNFGRDLRVARERLLSPSLTFRREK
jgi:hypothetical protein